MNIRIERLSIEDLIRELNTRICLLEYRNADSILRHEKAFGMAYIPVYFKSGSSRELSNAAARVTVRQIPSAETFELECNMHFMRSHLYALRSICSENDIHFTYDPLFELLKGEEDD